jgi:hypothetical protein
MKRSKISTLFFKLYLKPRFHPPLQNLSQGTYVGRRGASRIDEQIPVESSDYNSARSHPFGTNFFKPITSQYFPVDDLSSIDPREGFSGDIRDQHVLKETARSAQAQPVISYFDGVTICSSVANDSAAYSARNSG